MKSKHFVIVLLIVFTALLVAAGCSSSAEPTPAPATTIEDVIWEWVLVKNKSTNEITNVPNPENYNIIFNTDGTMTGKADCNNFSGTYATDNGFTITLGPSTMAFCGEDSLDTQYLQLLGEIAAGGLDGAGGLALETAGGAERMEFQNGGAAPKS